MLKNTFFILLLFSFSSIFSQRDSIFSQRDQNNTWKFKLGVNLVQDLQDKTPFSGFSQFETTAFNGLPLFISVEKRINNIVGIDLSASFNRWESGKGIIAGTTVTENVSYNSVDASLNIYLNKIFSFSSDIEWLDVYAKGGFGYFDMPESAISLSFGAGFSIWFSDKIGLDLGVIGKRGNVLKLSPGLEEIGHIQHYAGLVMRF